MSGQKMSARMWLMLFAIGTAELAGAFETGMIYTALAVFLKEFGDPIGVGWLLTGYLLVGGATVAICSRLGDIYGRRRVVLIMLAICAIGSLVSAFATSLTWVIVGRCLQGMAAPILPLCYGLAREHMPPARVPLAIGVIGGTAAAGVGAGILLGGVIVDNFSWHALFYWSTAIVIVGWLVVFTILPPSQRQPSTKPLDVVGALLFAPAVAALLFAVSKGAAWGWFDARTLGLAFGALAVLSYWVYYELQQEEPMIDVRLLANRQILLANICMGLAAFGAMQAQVISLLLQQPTWTLVGLGASATLAGALKVPGNIAGSLSSPVSGWVASKYGGRMAMMVGALICAVGWTALTFDHSQLWIVAATVLITGSGIVFLFAAIPNVIVEVCPKERTSEATGLSVVVRTTFHAAGGQILAVVMASSTITDPARGKGVFPTEQAYTTVFVVIALCCWLCVLIAYMLPHRARAPLVLQSASNP
ncbi:MFS transporter [Noviherbaspirillum sedimenti]|uniref:MFS transporter n=1 Tax=Noviherbaspirillum sedimenti TaxID=2320865 RepID=A0A3A3GID3_9BURK|nr:MFS transporter [Noviherbaspirillum sedimenti]RJG00670.1 MFS transporter [Noviherbaspirillum sedimenti]